MEITLFRGARDTSPDNIPLSWPDLCEFARGLIRVEFPRSRKLDHHAMIFGRCEGKRANANVRFLSGLCADLDNGPDHADYVGFEAMCDRLEAEGLAFVAYTTTKNSAGHNKYRLIMPYARNVAGEWCEAAWHLCDHRFGHVFDRSTKDPARLSFLPANWTENPFLQPSTRKGQPDSLLQLSDPFNAIRINVGGEPVLSEAAIDALPRLEQNHSTIRRSSYSAPIIRLSDAEREKLAHGKSFESPCWDWLADLHRSPLVHPWMIQKLPGEEGNREYRFMIATVRNAIANNFPINAEALIVLTEQFSTECLGRPPREDFARQAENALSWALRSTDQEPSSPEANNNP